MFDGNRALESKITFSTESFGTAEPRVTSQEWYLHGEAGVVGALRGGCRLGLTQ